MPRKKSPTLTDAELRVMQALWDLGEGPVAEVQAKTAAKPPLAYTTILTTLRILEEKGYVTHRQEGRAYIYQPLVDRDTARRKTVDRLVSQFYDGSAAALVLNVLEHEELDAEEIARLRELIDEAERGTNP